MLYGDYTELLGETHLEPHDLFLFHIANQNGALSKHDCHLNLKYMNNFMAFYHVLTILTKTKPFLVFISNIGETVLPLKLWFHYSSLKKRAN